MTTDPEAEAAAAAAAGANLPELFARVVAAADDLADPLTDEERYYTERARAANTRRGYRSDLEDFAGWCAATDPELILVLPSAPTGQFESPSVR